MKSKIFIFSILMILMFPIKVGAHTFTGNFETVYDDKGRVVQGIFNYHTKRLGDNEVGEEKDRHFTFGGGICYISYIESPVQNDEKSYTFTGHCVDENGNINPYGYKLWSVTIGKGEGYNSGEYNEDSMNATTNLTLYSFIGPTLEGNIDLCTIPMFNENDVDYQQKVNDYLQAGSYVPDDDVPYSPPGKQYDESVELPKNLKLSSGYNYNLLARQNLLFPDKDIVLTWDQTQDTNNYSYEIELKYKLEHVTNTNLLGKETTETYNSSYVKVGNGFYAGANNITHTIGHDKQNDELSSITQTNGWTGTKSYIKNIYIRVRNISGGKCSNWVVVSLDVPNKNATAVVQDDNGNTVQDDNYNNYDAINGDQVNSDNVGSLDDFKKITDFIKNGFDLLGSGGLVGLLSSFFGNIFPQSFWNIITTGMAVIILVGIINFLLKR